MSPHRILLVEDNDTNREMLQRRLTRNGFQVLEALDGRQAIDMMLSDPPDLVLMDMSIPVLDGWAATQQIKADARISHIPVIALTAHAMVGEREKALACGCDDYDIKPVELERLLGKMKHLLKR